jgi:hypothetical protein
MDPLIYVAFETPFLETSAHKEVALYLSSKMPCPFPTLYAYNIKENAAQFLKQVTKCKHSLTFLASSLEF